MQTVALVGNSTLSMAKFRAPLLQALIESGYRVVVVSPRDEFVDDIRSLGCEWIDWKLSRRSANPFSELRAVLQLYLILRNLNPSFAQFFTIKPNIYGSFISKLLRIQHFVVMTGLGYVFINRNLLSLLARKLYKMSLRWPSKVIFLNEADQEAFLSRNLVDEKKCFILPGEGVDDDMFKPRDSKPKDLFIFMGRILWDKGFREFVEAARAVKKNHPGTEFLAIGKIGFGNPSDVPLDYVRSVQAEGTVIYQEFVKDVRNLLTEVKFNVLPSYREGIPTTVLESGCMGIPSIVSDAPGCRDVVVPGVTGFMCEVKSETSLQEAMETALAMSESSYEEMGLAARKFITSNFSKERILSCYKSLYAEIGLDLSGVGELPSVALKV